MPAYRLSKQGQLVMGVIVFTHVFIIPQSQTITKAAFPRLVMNHASNKQAQKHHYWGFSPSSCAGAGAVASAPVAAGTGAGAGAGAAVSEEVPMKEVMDMGAADSSWEEVFTSAAEGAAA